MSTPVPNPDGWLSWHVHVPADAEGTDRLTPLVREQLPALLAPLRAAGLLHRWFFIRYWEGGPHLRIRLLPRPGAGRAATPDALDAAVRRAFADVPRDGHDPEGYLASIGDLAAASVASDPTVDRRVAATVLPPGVHAAGYVPETDRYGTGAALEATEEVFMLSSELALRAAGSGLDELRLRLLGVEVLLKAAASAGVGVPQGAGCRTVAVQPIPYWFSCGPTPTTGAAGPGRPRRRCSPRNCWRSTPPTGPNSWCRAGG